MLYSLIFGLIIIKRETSTITTLSILWSTPSSSRGSPTAALLLLTKPRMHVLSCLLVFLKSRSVVMSLGPRLEPIILVSHIPYYHVCKRIGHIGWS